jgi:phosphoribosylformylglycinamidine synthase
VLEFVLAAAGAGLLRSAHDLAEGGLLVALAECCLLGARGVRCPPLHVDGDLRMDALLFGETQGRFIVSLPSRSMPEIQNLSRKHRVEIEMLGLTGGDQLEFEGQFAVSLHKLRAAWEGSLR